MRIGFDAKRLFANSTGLGTYSRTLFNRLLQYYSEDDYILYVHQKYYKETLYKYPDYTQRTYISNYYNDKLWRSSKIAEDIQTHDIQIYHGLSNELPMSIGSNVKKVVTIHDVIFKTLPKTFSFFDRKIYYLKWKKAIQEADAIIAVSEQTRQDILSYFKAEESKIKVIYPTWNKEFEHHCSYSLKEEFLQKYALPRDFILYVGDISKRKNFLVLLKALQLPENQDKNIVVVTQGGDEYQKAQRLVFEYQMQSRVYFMQHILWYELPIIYHLSQALVYPSLYEGFGLPVLEALVCGKPVIVANNSSLKEVGGDACIFINEKNVEELSHAINFIYYNLDLAEEVKFKAAQQIRKFHPETVTQQLHNLYLSLL